MCGFPSRDQDLELFVFTMLREISATKSCRVSRLVQCCRPAAANINYSAGGGRTLSESQRQSVSSASHSTIRCGEDTARYRARELLRTRGDCVTCSAASSLPPDSVNRQQHSLAQLPRFAQDRQR